MLLELLARPARRGALVRRGHGMHTRPVVTGPVKQAISLRLAPHRGVPEPEVCLETSVEIVAVLHVFIAVGVTCIFRVGENKVRQQTCRRFMLERINTPYFLLSQAVSQLFAYFTVEGPAPRYSLSPLQPPPWWLVRVCEKSIGRCLTRDRLTVRDCMYPCGWVAAGPWCLAKQRTVSTRAQISGDFAVQVAGSNRCQGKSSQVQM